jgi:hypothetical protein
VSGAAVSDPPVSDAVVSDPAVSDAGTAGAPAGARLAAPRPGARPEAG